MAIWTLRSALEETPMSRPVPTVPPPQGPPRPNIASLDGLVPGAAQWIFYAGRLIHSSDDDYGRLGEGGDLFRGGKQGFSPERWNFWKDRFRWVEAQEDVQETTRAIAGKAARAMDQID